MATIKSPFLVYENFLTPNLCEQIVNRLGFYSPDIDIHGNPIKMMRHHDWSESIIFSRLQNIIPHIEEYYNIQYKGTERINFEYFAQGVTGSPVCESSVWQKNKWVKTIERDISGILFFCDMQGKPPFDSDYEVYGGKLEFTNHQFGFNPQRGTLILYPSTPHFANATSSVLVGDLIQSRLHLTASKPFKYNPKDFPGNFQNWFQGLY